MKEYLTLLTAVQGRGEDREDRTGVGTRSIFGHQSRYNLEEGFPLLTTKKLHVDSIIHELIWFLRGDTNIKYLQENGVRIWNEWADADGEIGPMYGKQWRSWPTPKGEVDQLAKVVDQLKRDPTSRRHVISAWNVGQLDEMALAPCHCLIQFYVRWGDRLDCQVYQRSADVFLGVPFNIASYALLTHLVANQVGLKAGRFIHTLGDAHIYQNHFDQVDTQLRREPKDLPKLILHPGTDLFNLKREDIVIEGYDPEPHIPAPIAV